MANKVLNARFQSKYDTYSNWTSVNPVLLKGEVAIVVVPASSGAVTQEPAILIKVGDGAKHFNDLGFISAYAADIHDWAKASSKPSYTASEITGLNQAINNYITDELGISVDTNTTYKVEMTSDGDGIIVSSKEKGAEDWTAGTPIKFTAFVKTITEGSTNGTIAVDGADVAVHGLGSAAYTASTAYDAAGAATTVENTINAKLGTLTSGTFAEAITALRTATSTNNTNIAVLRGDVTTIKGDYLKSADKSELEKSIEDVETSLNNEKDATKEGSLAKQIKTEKERIDAFLLDAGVGEQAVDTLKEIQDYITSDGQAAAEVTSKIATLEAAIGEGGSVSSQIKNAIDALALDTTYETKGAANTAEKNACSYADGLATNYDTKGAADAAEASAKSYAETKATAAETAAKSYADSLATNYDAVGAAAAAETNAKKYTDTKTANSANWDKAQENVIETVRVNGTALNVTNKAVDITVPTKIDELDQNEYLILYAGSATEVMPAGQN